MRRAHTVEQVRAAEEVLLASQPEGALMQRAAAGLAYAVGDLLGETYGRRVVLLVGAGNNGGDALWAGAMLARRGAAVEAWLLADQVHGAGLAALRRAGSSASGAVPACGSRRSARSSTSRASRWSRSTPPAASTSTPASSTART
jgi:NAD(P)H-hydrate repair Nnr-like enzyme with NAD(P)H-hydrate epimerase domain